VFIIHHGNGHTRQETLPPVDSLRAELDAFVESIVGQKPPPIPATQMIDTVAVFEASITSINSGMATMVGATSSD
jgi:predicted dehydrogenase